MRHSVRSFLRLFLSFLISALCCAAAMAKGQARPVSVTLGSVEYRNWEDNLVKGNRNLRHFHWNPIYSNVQGMKMVKPMPKPPIKGTTPPRKRERGIKGSKNSPNVIFKPVRQRPSFYKRPVRVMPQHAQRTSTDYQHFTAVTRRDINGKLILPEPEPDTSTMAELRRQRELLDQLSGKLTPPTEPQVALSGKLKVPPHHGKKNVSGQLMTNKVEGQLVAKSLNAELVDKSLQKFQSKTNPSTLTYGNYDSVYSTTFSAKNSLTRSDVNGKIARSGRNY